MTPLGTIPTLSTSAAEKPLKGRLWSHPGDYIFTNI